MFKSLPDSATETVTVYINGQKTQVAAGISVAAAVLEKKLPYTRTTPVSGDKRLPYCMMGVCYDCLMIIDDIPNQRACSSTVQQGMRIDIQEKTGEELLPGEFANE